MPRSWAGDTKNVTSLGFLATFGGFLALTFGPPVLGVILQNDSEAITSALFVFGFVAYVRWHVWVWDWQRPYEKVPPEDLERRKVAVHVVISSITRGAWRPYTVDHEVDPPPPPEVNRRAARRLNALLVILGAPTLALLIANWVRSW